MRVLLQRLFRTAVIVAPFAYILWRVDFGLFLRTARQASWWTLPAASALVLLVMVLQGLRWHVLLRAFIKRLSMARTMSIYFQSLFYSLVLPTSAGQDVARAVMLAREEDYRVVWGSTWVCRMLGLSVLVVLALAGLPFMPAGQKPAGLDHAVYAGSAAIMLLVVLSFTKSVTSHFRPFLARLLPARIAKVLADVRQGIYLYRYQRRAVGTALAMTVVTQLVSVLSASTIIAGISGRMPFLACLVLVPIIEIVCMSVPLTPSGVGVRESLVLLFFGHIGLSQEQIAVYMVFGLVGIVLRLVGAAPVLLETRRRATQPHARTTETR